jgi:hypothetical protein
LIRTSKEEIMSVSGISSGAAPFLSAVPGNFRQRRIDYLTRDSALYEGDLGPAQKAFATLQQDLQTAGLQALQGTGVGFLPSTEIIGSRPTYLQPNEWSYNANNLPDAQSVLGQELGVPGAAPSLPGMLYNPAPPAPPAPPAQQTPGLAGNDGLLPSPAATSQLPGTAGPTVQPGGDPTSDPTSPVFPGGGTTPLNAPSPASPTQTDAMPVQNTGPTTVPLNLPAWLFVGGNPYTIYPSGGNPYTVYP